MIERSMNSIILLQFAILVIRIKGTGRDLVDIVFEPSTSAFTLDANSSLGGDNTEYFATASNVDIYSLTINLGVHQKRLTFTGDKEVPKSTLLASVHVFNSEVDEKSKTVHFVCHFVSSRKIFEVKPLPSQCCIISLNTSFSHEFTSCVLDPTEDKTVTVCHAEARLPSVLWKQKNSPVISLSYTFSPMNPNTHGNNHQCHIRNTISSPVFHLLPTATVVRSVPDAIRELGRSLLLQIPRRELRTNEEFIVPVRLKRGDDVSDFTLRCEIPSNSYVEFVRVIWPGGLSSGKQTSGEFGTLPAHSLLPDSLTADANTLSSAANVINAGATPGLHNVWDVFHRTILSQKRNVTEIVARFREDLARVVSAKHSPSTEVYKLLFRVNRPPAGSPGRVAPRIFWSLISLSRRNSPDRTAGGSPIVTRLNIESSELKHLAMVLKTTALVNLAVLTGRPAVYPVWVYGLTHDSRLIDVTSRATCHSGDDAVIHFAADDCRKLGFSGAELDGSPGLPLVAKLDGRSATATLLVWFPKSPALRLAVDGLASTWMSGSHTSSPAVVLKRLSAGPVSLSSTSYGASSWSYSDYGHNVSTVAGGGSILAATQFGSQMNYQFARIRVLARFILAGSVLYDKDVLGGKIDQYVDVTSFTAHRIRLEESDWFDRNGAGDIGSVRTISRDHGMPGRLLLIDRDARDHGDEESALRWVLPENETNRHIVRAWLIGQRVGRMRVRLAPIDRARLKANMPPGLVKQLKDQKSELVDPTDVDSFGDDDALWTGTVKDEPSLDLLIRDDPGTWPVGLSVQIVTDFSVILSQVTDQETDLTSGKPTTARSSATSDTNTYTPDHLMPLYSGLYALQFTLHGGKMAHSGAVATDFHELLRRATQPSVLSGRPIELRNRTNPTGSPDIHDPPNTGLILVWIHMSDGTSILWNHLKEISAASGRALPFKLTLNNLRPDLFRVWDEGLEPIVNEERPRSHLRRRKRGVSSWWNPNTRGSFTQRDLHNTAQATRSTHLTELGTSSASAMPTTSVHLTGVINHSSGPWTGPSIRFLRSGFSYSGEVLEVGLSSTTDQIVVPPTRVQADFLMPPTHSLVPGLKPDSQTNLSPETDRYGESVGRSPVPPILGLPFTNSNHGYLALKDAPGFRNLPPEQQKQLLEHSPRKLVEGDQLHETSLSDQRGDEKVGTGLGMPDDGLGEIKSSGGPVSSDRTHGGSALGNPELDTATTGNGSRPALELSMYILLGLFALVGLVFAVNCGAVVARYRWERLGRHRSTARAEVDQHMEEVGEPNQSETGVQGQAQATLPGSTAESKQDAQEESSLRRYSKLLMPFRNKNKALLHRDTNWVWIGRDKTGESQNDPHEASSPSPLGDCHRSPNSPLLGLAELPKGTNNMRGSRGALGGNSRKSANPSASTTAVLSVGEADMLLMHSPYHQDAWQDTLRSVNPERSEGHPYRTGWPYSGQSDALQDFRDMSNVSATVGRQTRRHTTGVLTQRNYQGQECSIRIISNPMSQSASSPQDGRESIESGAQDARSMMIQALQTSHSWAVCDTNHNSTPLSSADNRLLNASASVGRKHRTRSEWDGDEDNDVTDVEHSGPNDWPLGMNPYPSPWTLMPPPNQPAPPVPYGHLRPQDAAYYWEAVMYRSWVRPRPGWKCSDPQPETKPSNRLVNPPCQAKSPWDVRARSSVTNTTGASASGAEPWEYARAAHMLKTLRESREHTFDRHGEESRQTGCAVPFPPIRTTSRTADSRTLEADKAKRKLSLDANPRPLSLPQNFQATNELYGVVSEDSSDLGDGSGEVGLSAGGQEPTRRADRSTVQDTCPSEESLWWYHPVRRRKKRKHEHTRHQNDHPHPLRTEPPANAIEVCVANTPLLDGSVEPTEYACPAPCECDCDQQIFKATKHRVKDPCMHGAVSIETGPGRKAPVPTALLHASTLTSLSDEAWDRDLLALSHDRLVAYFAGMKESNA